MLSHKAAYAACLPFIASASKGDDAARWVKHKGKPAVHGFKAHVGADAAPALVEEIAITPANIHDGKAGGEALPDHAGEVFADRPYAAKPFEQWFVPKVARCAGRLSGVLHASNMSYNATAHRFHYLDFLRPMVSGIKPRLANRLIQPDIPHELLRCLEPADIAAAGAGACRSRAMISSGFHHAGAPFCGLVASADINIAEAHLAELFRAVDVAKVDQYGRLHQRFHAREFEAT